MYEIFYTLVYFIFILPALMFDEAYIKFKKFMSVGNRWWNLPYYLLAGLVLFLIFLLLSGYR